MLLLSLLWWSWTRLTHRVILFLGSRIAYSQLFLFLHLRWAILAWRLLGFLSLGCFTLDLFFFGFDFRAFLAFCLLYSLSLLYCRDLLFFYFFLRALLTFCFLNYLFFQFWLFLFLLFLLFGTRLAWLFLEPLLDFHLMFLLNFGLNNGCSSDSNSFDLDWLLSCHYLPLSEGSCLSF